MRDACVSEEDLNLAAGVEFVEGANPEVLLVDFSEVSDLTLAAVTRGYSGRYDWYITPEDAEKYLDDLAGTKLKTPLAFINTVWLFNGMTRAWCNQLERYRVGTAFVQESLRFSVHQRVRVLVPSRLVREGGAALDHFKVGARTAVYSYRKAMEEGAAPEDARGLLPLNTLTSMFASLNMQTLTHLYAQRSCCQAQSEEWTPVIKEIKARVHDYLGATMADFLKAPWEGGEVDCGFHASFDRPCALQQTFDTNLAMLVGSRGLRMTHVGWDTEPEVPGKESIKQHLTDPLAGTAD